MQQIITIITIIGVIINGVSNILEKKKYENNIDRLEKELNHIHHKIDELEKRIEDNNTIVDYFESELNKIKHKTIQNQNQDQNLTDLIQYNYDFL